MPRDEGVTPAAGGPTLGTSVDRPHDAPLSGASHASLRVVIYVTPFAYDTLDSGSRWQLPISPPPAWLRAALLARSRPGPRPLVSIQCHRGTCRDRYRRAGMA